MPLKKIPQVAVVGAGYWGRNLVRVFHTLGALRWVCDVHEATVAELAAGFNVLGTTALDEVLADPDCSAVVLAVPAAQHYQVAKLCLRAGKDVYVEKPLALKSTEGQELVNLAHKLGRVLMVGHILEYHPAILELKRLIHTGELGRIYYISSSRLNLGKLRTEENILWSFAPHDLSAIIFLLNETPRRVSTMGGCYLNARHPDTTLSTCDFESGTQAHIFVSWLHPFKEQKLAVVGSRKMAVFDDMERERKLVLYSHEVNWVGRTPVAKKDEGQVVELPAREPLAQECQHFLECVCTRQVPRTSGETGVRVLRVLEACEKSLVAMGAPVELVPAPSFSVHETAVVDDGAEIGEGTKIWHFSHIMSGSTIGKNCNLGQNVVISPGVRIGDNVKIQNNVSVYTGVELEDDVFCGPSMVFTNVVNPRSHVVRRDEYRRTLVKRGASIGANATIICGVTLGEYSFIGAGAVVTQDVPAYVVMAGVPAEQIGWMCSCGIKLPDSPDTTCSSCGRKYMIKDHQCTELTPSKAGDFEEQQNIAV